MPNLSKPQMRSVEDGSFPAFETRRPLMRCFRRAEELSFEECIDRLLHVPVPTRDEYLKRLMTDALDGCAPQPERQHASNANHANPHDTQIARCAADLVEYVNRVLPKVLRNDDTKALVDGCRLTNDELRMLIAFRTIDENTMLRPSSPGEGQSTDSINEGSYRFGSSSLRGSPRSSSPRSPRSPPPVRSDSNSPVSAFPIGSNSNSKNKRTGDTVVTPFALQSDEPRRVFPLRDWLNGLLIHNRRDVDNVGPAFILLYRAMEKLPKARFKGYRSVRVLKGAMQNEAVFEKYAEHFIEKRDLNSWGWISFCDDEDVVATSDFSGAPDERVLIFSCENLCGVDLEPFRPFGATSLQPEITPLAPAIFEVCAAPTKNGNRVEIKIAQCANDEECYVNPRKDSGVYGHAAHHVDSLGNSPHNSRSVSPQQAMARGNVSPITPSLLATSMPTNGSFVPIQGNSPAEGKIRSANINPFVVPTNRGTGGTGTPKAMQSLAFKKEFSAKGPNSLFLPAAISLKNGGGATMDNADLAEFAKSANDDTSTSPSRSAWGGATEHPSLPPPMKPTDFWTERLGGAEGKAARRRTLRRICIEKKKTMPLDALKKYPPAIYCHRCDNSAEGVLHRVERHNVNDVLPERDQILDFGIEQCIECDCYLPGRVCTNEQMLKDEKLGAASDNLWKEHSFGFYRCESCSTRLCTNCYRKSRHLRQFSIYTPNRPYEHSLFGAACCTRTGCLSSMCFYCGGLGGSYGCQWLSCFHWAPRGPMPDGMPEPHNRCEATACVALFVPFSIFYPIADMICCITPGEILPKRDAQLNQKFGFIQHSTREKYCLRMCVHARQYVQAELVGEPQHCLCGEQPQRMRYKQQLPVGPDPFELYPGDVVGRFGAYDTSLQVSSSSMLHEPTQEGGFADVDGGGLSVVPPPQAPLPASM